MTGFDRDQARDQAREVLHDAHPADWTPTERWMTDVLDRLAECWTNTPHLLHGYTLEEWEHRAARAEGRLARIAALCDEVQRRADDSPFYPGRLTGSIPVPKLRAILLADATPGIVITPDPDIAGALRIGADGFAFEARERILALVARLEAAS